MRRVAAVAAGESGLRPTISQQNAIPTLLSTLIFDSLKDGDATLLGNEILVANRAVHERRRSVRRPPRSGALPAIVSLILLKRRSCLSLVCAAS